MNGFTGFFHGFAAPMYGVRLLLSDKRLRALAIIPLVISVLLGSVLTVFGLYSLVMGLSSFSSELAKLVGIASDGYGIVLLTIVLWPLALLVLGVGIYVCIRLVAAPFYSLLAEKTLVVLGAKKENPLGLHIAHLWVWTAFRMFFVSLVKALLFGLASVILFVFSFIPILNFAATVGFMHMLAFDISDYCFEAMEWPLAKRFQHVREHMITYTGLACGVGLAMLIPGLNLILMPAVVVGAGETLHRTLGASREIV